MSQSHPENFALIGVAGYIAVRHLKAIRETNNKLVAALDLHDSVGIIDGYFPDADFFVEFERFDRHIDMLRRKGIQVGYVSICSPNYLHDSHIRFAMRSGANAICEKPVVLNPWNIDALIDYEQETGKKVYNILQLRLHPSIQELKQAVMKDDAKMIYDIDLTYITSRGNWYHYSWKGNTEKSGGIATNIGVHFFDMLIWIFGGVRKNITHLSRPDKASGMLHLERANVRWYLSIDEQDLPGGMKQNGKRTYRSITLNNKEIEFSDGFTDLHTKTYREILAGKGFGLDDARASIKTVYEIRNAAIMPAGADAHPMLKKVL